MVEKKIEKRDMKKKKKKKRTILKNSFKYFVQTATVNIKMKRKI